MVQHATNEAITASQWHRSSRSKMPSVPLQKKKFCMKGMNFNPGLCPWASLMRHNVSTQTKVDKKFFCQSSKRLNRKIVGIRSFLLCHKRVNANQVKVVGVIGHWALMILVILDSGHIWQYKPLIGSVLGVNSISATQKSGKDHEH